MNSRFLTTLVSAAILAAVSAPLNAGEVGTQGVSPGAIERITQVEAKCPAFSWQASPTAEGYEIVVYQLDENLVDVAEADLETATEVLYQELPGRTTSWTPGLADCFGPGEQYVWFVRAVLDANTGEGTEWSDPRFFEVAAAPSAEELERAIEVIRRWEAAGGGGSATLSSVAAPVAASDIASAPVPDSGSGSGPPKSVITGTAAIRGEQPDFSGETYGVVGTSASPDGAGFGAANSAGGPDLVLDGSAAGAADAELRESGIDRPSASPQVFTIGNSGGGGMTLQVDGVEVVTTATDQDTVGALSCAPDEIAKFIGGVWICAPDLDTNTDTLAALSCHEGLIAKRVGGVWVCTPDEDALGELSCGRNEIAKWNDLSGVWECAHDQDTRYSAGPGMLIEDGQIILDPAWFSTEISTIDDPGYENSVAIGVDGFGLISYRGQANNLKVAHCNDKLCSGAEVTTLDSSGSMLDSSVTIGADGFGLISYYDFTNGDLKVAHCNDTHCSSASIATLDTIGDVGKYNSIGLGADGLGLISYLDFTNANLRVAHCDDAACTTATISILDNAGDVGFYTSVAIGADGLGLISYGDLTISELKVAHCDDIPCTSATTSALDGSFVSVKSTSIAIGADGLGLISYLDWSDSVLKVAHCFNPTCSGATVSTIKDVGFLNWTTATSVMIGADGFGLITYLNQDSFDLEIARCLDLRCQSSTTSIVVSTGTAGRFSDAALGSDELPLISYQGDYSLRVAHLPYGY